VAIARIMARFGVFRDDDIQDDVVAIRGVRVSRATLRIVMPAQAGIQLENLERIV